RWALLVYAVFVTHVLLDCFTVYGTQVLWPFVTTPVGWSTVFIIDPLYTLPLLAGLLALLVLRRNPHRARRLNTAGLVLSSLYLAWTVGAKLEVERAARASLAASGLDTAPLLSTPAPFNSLLWRVVVMTGDGYLEGFHSLLDGELPVRFSRRQSEPALLAGLQSHPPVQRLQWFTKGFYAVERVDDRVVISDLRMGMYPDYAFRFTVGEVSNPHSRPAAPGRWRAPVDYRGRLSRVWERIWDPGVRIN
ncbi:MAG TPA: metal-dependent hydrolase, partial [Gammaproteobacteria bacterium]